MAGLTGDRGTPARGACGTPGAGRGEVAAGGYRPAGLWSAAGGGADAVSGWTGRWSLVHRPSLLGKPSRTGSGPCARPGSCWPAGGW